MSSTITRKLFDITGKPISLGREIGRGGEGVVYNVDNSSDQVAKIYLVPPAGEYQSKLSVMVANATVDLLRFSAWPTGTIFEGGKIAGFLMPKIGGFKPMFELYGPKLRLQNFPKADWRFLARSAANVARAVAAVHDAGHVIGDINHGNIVVGNDATVRIIDCDSCQVTIGGQTWNCEVGVATHQPPELQNRSLKNLRRTQNHDSFGLAVLVFQLLCMGRHPFSGQWMGPGEQPSIEEAIRDFRYAYANNSSQTKMMPPPGSLDIRALGRTVTTLFERSFSRDGSYAEKRPIAQEWIKALTDFEAVLFQCASNKMHFFRKDAGSCPWCSIETQTGAALFITSITPAAAGLDFKILWQQAEAVQMPRRSGPLQMPPLGRPIKQAISIGKIKRLIAILAVVYAVIVAVEPFSNPFVLSMTSLNLLLCLLIPSCLGAYYVVVARRGLRICRQSVGSSDTWKALSEKLTRNTDADRAYDLKSQIEKLKSEFDASESERNNKIRALMTNLESKQLETHLRRFLIKYAKIPGMGLARIATLHSCNIITAADVSWVRIQSISGFGSVTAGNIMGWRDETAKSFRFNPNDPAATAGIAAIQRAFELKKSSLDRRMSTALAELRGRANSALAIQAEVDDTKRAVEPLYATGLANKKAISILNKP